MSLIGRKSVNVHMLASLMACIEIERGRFILIEISIFTSFY